MPQDDEAYYRRRLLDEEEAVRESTSRAARERHEELAAAYRVRLRCAGLSDLVPRSFRSSGYPIDRAPLIASRTDALDYEKAEQGNLQPMAPALVPHQNS